MVAPDEEPTQVMSLSVVSILLRGNVPHGAWGF